MKKKPLVSAGMVKRITRREQAMANIKIYKWTGYICPICKGPLDLVISENCNDKSKVLEYWCNRRGHIIESMHFPNTSIGKILEIGHKEYHIWKTMLNT